MINSPILSLQGASVHYSDESDGVRKALNGVSLDVRQGEWLAVTGSNGSGKSTLAGVLLGLCPLSSGKLQRSGRLRVRAVLQHPESQVLGDTVEEEFYFAAGGNGGSHEELRRLLADALVRVKLNLRPNKPLAELSGGQKQLVNIAAALASEPDLLILDEPTAMLDPAAREAFLEIIRKAHASGMTIVWITHRMEEAAAADRILALASGSTAFDGSPECFFYGEAALPEERMYSDRTPCERLELEPPYVVRTVQALLAQGISVPGCPLHPEELVKAVIRPCP